MDIRQLCGTVKGRVTLELQGKSDAVEREEILITALYELSRSVFPMLGPPGRSQEYLAGQGAVLDLISSITIPLIRNSTNDRRGVVVLTEIGECCLDPMLRKKLSVYAQELLAKSCSGARDRHQREMHRAFLLLGLGAAAALAWYLAWPAPAPYREKPTVAAALAPVTYPTTGYHDTGYQTAAQLPAAACAGGERVDAETEHPTQLALADNAGADRAEQTTRVRIANNQVLIPVILKNGGETVRAELLLDTGSTRTAIHEELARQLRIDLRLAKASQAEVADGRIIPSRMVTIDSLDVGPFAMASAEVELIPFQGSEGIHDGLLGMDFLGKHLYQIDMEHELVRWF